MYMFGPRKFAGKKPVPPLNTNTHNSLCWTGHFSFFFETSTTPV